LGAGGCLFGASMPYHHPVGVAVSVLWWGLYFGCFGTSLGALLGLWAEQTPAPPSQGSEGADEPPSRGDRHALPIGYGGSLSGTNRASIGVSANSTRSPDGSAHPIESVGRR
jgi:hypothetical protein